MGLRVLVFALPFVAFANCADACDGAGLSFGFERPDRRFFAVAARVSPRS